MYIHSHTAKQLFLTSHILALALLRITENKCYLVRGYVAAVTIPIVETAEAAIAGATSGVSLPLEASLIIQISVRDFLF